MTHDEIRQLLIKTLNNSRPSGWALDYRFLGDAVDSLDHASFVLALEEAAGIKVPDEDLASLDSIEHVAAYVSTKTKRAQ